MSKNTPASAGLVMALLTVGTLPAGAANPKDDLIGPVEVSYAVQSDVSVPLRDMTVQCRPPSEVDRTRNLPWTGSDTARPWLRSKNPMQS